MLAHLKAKQRDSISIGDVDSCAKRATISSDSTISDQMNSFVFPEDVENTAKKLTSDVLCSMGSTSPPPRHDCPASSPESSINGSDTGLKSGKGCPKQHQLPMFLSKTYHMIDRCDQDIATWSVTGDNFVVKNVERFAGSVLPQYFKHSNFSSFARQLNFYGFRKLKAEPILTADFDARTACYVRFYHEKFQKDRPDLLAQIKRATKSDQQSKDDVESLKNDICKLTMGMNRMKLEFDRKITEMNSNCLRRISAVTAEYENLAVMMRQVMASQGDTLSISSHGNTSTSLHFAAVPSLDPVPSLTQASAMMRSLSEVPAIGLVKARHPSPTTSQVVPESTPPGTKRAAEISDTLQNAESRARYS